MNAIPEIETERLVLRAWREADLEAYAQRIFADADVMQYLPKRAGEMPRARAKRTMNYFNAHWLEHGYGAWAVTDEADGQFIGHCGLNYLKETNEVEVLYALAKEYWGKGIATEAARASVRFGFEQARLKIIIALAFPENIASRRVMEHLGLAYVKNAPYFGVEVAYYALARASFHSEVSIYRLRQIQANSVRPIHDETITSI